MRHLFLLLLCIIVFPTLRAQTITEGQFQYEVTSYDFPDYMDSLLAKSITQSIERGVNEVWMAFRDSILVTTTIDSLSGEITYRSVADARKDSVLTFGNYFGDPVYYTLSTSDWIKQNRTIKTETDVINRNPGNTIFDLITTENISVVPHTNKNHLDTIEAQIATNVDFSPYARFLPMPEYDLDRLFTSFTISVEDIKLTIGIRSFSSKVTKPEWFNTSTDSLLSQKEAFEKIETEYEAQKKIGKGKNHPLLHSLIEKKILPNPEDNFEIQLILEQQSSIDLNYIFSLISTYNPDFINLPKDSLLQFLSDYKTTYPTLVKIASGIEKLSSTKDKWGALTWGYCNDVVNNLKVRKQLYENLVSLELTSTLAEPLLSEFLDGRASWEHFLLQTGYFRKISLPPHKNNTNDLTPIVKDILDQVYNEEFPDLKVLAKDDFLTIETKAGEYSIHLEEILVVDYRKMESQSKNQNLIYEDSFFSQNRFIEEIISILDQALIDEGRYYSYKLRPVDNFINARNKTLSFTKTKELFPEINLYSDEFYLIKEYYDGIVGYNNYIPIIFPAVDYYIDKQIHIKDYYFKEQPSDFLFTKSQTKEAFADFLETNKNSFNLTTKEVNDFRRSISSKILWEASTLLNSAPKTTLRLVNDRFVEKYTKIDTTINTIADLFPRISHFLEDDFNATNLHFTSEGLFGFSFDNEEYTVELKRTEILKKANQLSIQRGLTTKKIYTLPYQEEYDRYFYYLTPEQKDVVERIIGTKIILAFP